MSHPGRTFNRTQLLAQVWGGDSEVDERTVDVNVQRLRKILTEPGLRSLHPNGARIRLPVRRPDRPKNENWFSFLLFHAMFHA